MDSRIKLITAGCFLLCWFALFYVCVLFRSGDLAALEKAWFIRWFFVEKFDAVYGERVMSWLEARLSQQGFSNLCLDELLIKLSDVYCSLSQFSKV